VLEAALITQELTPAGLALKVRMEPEVVEAYEALFFNVYDRREDHMYMRNLVYPGTRLEEYFEEQMSKGNYGQHLMRIGYNRGLDTVLFFSGFRGVVLDGQDLMLGL